MDTPWVEIRIDLLPKAALRIPTTLIPWIECLKQKFQHIILTYKQGDTDAQRLETLSAILAETNCFVDIDYAEIQDYRDKLFKVAEDNQCLTILSNHLITWDGKMGSITFLIEQMQALQPFYTKLAIPSPTLFHTLDILSLYAHYEHLILIDAGPKGLTSRLLAPVLGAPFTYGYFDVPTAPNQPKASDIKRLLDEYQAVENRTIAIS